MSKVDKFLSMLKDDSPKAYDVETNGLKWKKHHVIGYSLSDGTDSFYVPVRHGGGGNIDQVEAFETEIARIVHTRTAPLITHNGKFDSHFSLNHGIELGCKLEDTMIAACLLDENRFSYSLENVAKLYPDIPQKRGKDLYAYMADKLGVANKPSAMGDYWRLAGDDPMAVEYAEGDTLTTWHVHNKQKKDIYGQNLEFIYNIENRLMHVLRKLERHGIKIDKEEIARIKAQVERLIDEASYKIPAKADFTPYNIRSKSDLREYFEAHNFTDWEFTAPTERFPTGQPKFDKLFLGQSEPGMILLQARALDHFKNSFVDPIDDFIFDGAIHTNYNQTQGETGFGTKSGRLSCNSPNMTQVPARDEYLGGIFRKIFVAREGYTYVEIDYSQIEPRLFSHYSGEPELIKGYSSTPEIDMHDVAAQLMGITRKKSKNLNLGLQYAMGVAKLAKQLGISEDEARQMYYRWKRTFPRVADFTKLASKVAELRGYVKTILNRRARFTDPRWSYRAANRIVQGGAADVLKYKLVQLDDYFTANKLEDTCKMLLNIHDSILFEIRDDVLQDTIKTIVKIMEDVSGPPFSIKVPFRMNYKKGKNWAQATYGKQNG